MGFSVATILFIILFSAFLLFDIFRQQHDNAARKVMFAVPIIVMIELLAQNDLEWLAYFLMFLPITFWVVSAAVFLSGTAVRERDIFAKGWPQNVVHMYPPDATIHTQSTPIVPASQDLSGCPAGQSCIAGVYQAQAQAQAQATTTPANQCNLTPLNEDVSCTILMVASANASEQQA